jgi:hypothetical protein
VTEEILKHISNQGMFLAVEALLDPRINRLNGAWEILVSWRGLQDVDNTWEPLVNLMYDVPILVQRYVSDVNNESLTRQQLPSSSEIHVV